MNKNLSLLYNEFHKETTLQKRVIKRKNFTYRNLIEVLEKYVNGKKTILDIGCGVGTLDFYLAKQEHKILGIDVSEKAIIVCKKNARILGFKKNLSFETLNFPEEKPQKNFDLIICNEVLEHIEEDKKTVESILKLLHPYGVAIFSVPSQNAPLYKLGLVRQFDKNVGHLRRYSPEELKILIKKPGFVILEAIKTEGIIRNFLFLNSIANKLIRILNNVEYLSDLVTFIDRLTIHLFGESNILLVAQKA